MCNRVSRKVREQAWQIACGGDFRRCLLEWKCGSGDDGMYETSGAWALALRSQSLAGQRDNDTKSCDLPPDSRARRQAARDDSAGASSASMLRHEILGQYVAEERNEVLSDLCLDPTYIGWSNSAATLLTAL